MGLASTVAGTDGASYTFSEKEHIWSTNDFGLPKIEGIILNATIVYYSKTAFNNICFPFVQVEVTQDFMGRHRRYSQDLPYSTKLACILYGSSSLK